MLLRSDPELVHDLLEGSIEMLGCVVVRGHIVRDHVHLPPDRQFFSDGCLLDGSSCDYEPSLGWPEDVTGQTNLEAAAINIDLEVPDDDGPELV